MNLEENIPNIEWPIKDGIYKVVQILIGENPYIRFGQNYHIDIVKKFADETGVQAIVDDSGPTPIFLLP